MNKWYFTNFPMGVFLGVTIASVFYFALDNNYIEPWGKYFTYGVSALGHALIKL